MGLRNASGEAMVLIVSGPSPTPADRDIAIVEDAAQDALVDVDALDLVQAISKVRRLMKPVLCTTRRLVTSVSVVQRWNQAFRVL